MNQCLTLGQSHFGTSKSLRLFHKFNTISHTGHCCCCCFFLHFYLIYLLSTVHYLCNYNRTTPLMTIDGANCFSLYFPYTHTHTQSVYVFVAITHCCYLMLFNFIFMTRCNVYLSEKKNACNEPNIEYCCLPIFVIRYTL